MTASPAEVFASPTVTVPRRLAAEAAGEARNLAALAKQSAEYAAALAASLATIEEDSPTDAFARVEKVAVRFVESARATADLLDYAARAAELSAKLAREVARDESVAAD